MLRSGAALAHRSARVAGGEVSLIALWWVVAFAQEPALKKSPQPSYPTSQVYDASVERRCELAVTIDREGRPSDVRPLVCDPEVEAWTVKKLYKWRWEPPSISGLVVKVNIVYTPPAMSRAAADPDYWRRREVGACTAHVRVAADGTPSMYRMTDGCTVTLAPVPATPEKATKKKAPLMCDLTFIAREGKATDVDRFRCPMPVWSHTLDVLQAWQWSQRTEKPEPWSVILQFDGAPAHAD